MIKAACHIHSEWSYDGRWPLSRLASSFAQRGYRALLMTEHDLGFSAAKWTEYQAACRAATTSALTIVPGMEYSNESNVVHVLVWGCPVFLGEGLPTTELLARVRAHNALAVLAHPSRREAWRLFDHSWAESLLGIELWNRKTDGWAPSPTAVPLLNKGSLVPFAGLDFHDARQLFPLSMGLSIEGELSEESIIAALRSKQGTACFLGNPLSRILNPATGFAFSAAERIRRPVARTARRLLRSNNSQRATALNRTVAAGGRSRL